VHLLTTIIERLGDGPKLQSHLARECNLGYASAVRWINDLTGLGILTIYRVEDHGNRKWRWVKLTHNGRKMLHRVQSREDMKDRATFHM